MAEERRTASEPGWVFADLHERTLSLAVSLVDEGTGRRPVGRQHVRLENADETGPTVDPTPVENPSGYHLFLDLPEAVTDVSVHVDTSESYLDPDPQDAVVPTGPDPDPSEYVVEVGLTPAPAYPFSGGATLVRGSVREPADPLTDATVGPPISGATVAVDGRDIETRTTGDGEFVLRFGNIAATGERRDDDGTLVRSSRRSSDGRRFIKVANADPRVVASHDGYDSDSERVRIEEGTTETADIVLQETP